MYLLIAELDNNNIPTKINTAFSVEERDIKLSKIKNIYPNAFYVEVSVANSLSLNYVIIDPINKTALFDETSYNSAVANNKWEETIISVNSKVAALEHIARFMEDFYDASPAKLAVKSQEFKDALLEQKAVRGQKPQ